MTRFAWLAVLLVGCPTPEPPPDLPPGDDDDVVDDDDTGDDDDTPSLDERLATALAEQDDPPTALVAVEHDPALVALGQALFFDPILSGNGDVACASCHHPAWGLSDGLSLTLGTGATGTGPARADGDHPPFVPRHSLELSNRGDPAWRSLFWDGRVAQTDAGLTTPAGLDPLPGLSGVLAAQALFPVLDPAEMRGQPGDLTAWGEPNELAALTEPTAIWAALTARLRAQPGYVDLFAAAYPGADPADWTFAEAVNAIAAWEATALSFVNTPWDQYLRGDTAALADVEKLGALVFFGAAGCGGCHSGPLFTDQEFHATGVVQIGPGLSPDQPFDRGRERVSGDEADAFAFRTPPLRNVAVSAPYMHDGVFLTLEHAVLHYASPETSAWQYDPADLHPDLQGTAQQGDEHIAELVDALSPLLPQADPNLVVGLSNVREFLGALTDPATADLSGLRPDSVPSGLPVP